MSVYIVKAPMGLKQNKFKRGFHDYWLVLNVLYVGLMTKRCKLLSNYHNMLEMLRKKNLCSSKKLTNEIRSPAPSAKETQKADWVKAIDISRQSEQILKLP